MKREVLSGSEPLSLQNLLSGALRGSPGVQGPPGDTGSPGLPVCDVWYIYLPEIIDLETGL